MKHQILSCPVRQWSGFCSALNSDRWEISGCVLAFLPALLLTAPFIGYLSAILGLPFGWVAWAAVALVSLLITIPIRAHFKVSSWGEALGLIILLGGIAAAYAAGSVSLGSGSSAVWYKSLNLIDNGHLYRAMPWLDTWVGAGVQPRSAYEHFGALVSDAQYTHGDLHFMGLPGGAWFFAWWGMISRSLLFAAPLLLMMATGIILERLLRHALPESGWHSRILLTLIILAMPVYLYFGRGMAPALYALPCYGIALLLLLKPEWCCGPYPALLIASLSIPILCGIDFILPFFVAVLLLTWHRPAWGLGLAISGLLAFFGLQVVEPLWFGQVIGMPIWVRGIAFFTLGFYLAGLALYRFLSEEKADRWAGSTLAMLLFYGGLLAAALFLFRKNGAVSVFSALAMVFSGVVLLAGLWGAPALLRRHQWPLIFRLMAAGFFLSHLLFFRERPIVSLYADYIAYIGLLLPLIWLSFALWVHRAHGWPRYLVLGALLALTLTQGWTMPRERGLNEDLRAFSRQVRSLGAGRETAIAYDPAMDQALVPLIWYSGLTPAPVLQGGEIDVLNAVTDDWLYITGHPADAVRASGTLAYTIVPSQQGALPAAGEPVEALWHLLDVHDILAGIRAQGTVYPSLTWRGSGVEMARAGHFRCTGLGVPIGEEKYLLIHRGISEDLTDRGLEVQIQGQTLSYVGKDAADMSYCFALPAGLDRLSAIDIYIDMPPEGSYGDIPDGLAIADIRLTGEIPDTIILR